MKASYPEKSPKIFIVYVFIYICLYLEHTPDPFFLVSKFCIGQERYKSNVTNVCFVHKSCCNKKERSQFSPQTFLSIRALI